MWGFTIKKTFFDFWDHLFLVVILNVGFLLLLAVPFLLPPWLYRFGVVPSAISFVVGILLLFLYSGAVSFMMKEVAYYRDPGMTEFIQFLKESWPSSLVFGGIVVCHLFVLMVAFPVYASMKSIFGTIALVLIFWFSVLWFLASLYFFPLRTQVDSNLKKILKKCFLVFFDNTGFTVFLAIGAAILFVLSFLTAFLLPGLTGILLWFQVGFKLRLLKYDYLETHPQVDRRQIPWDSLLTEDRERVGKRTLKGMIFPWKE
ncbi:MAG: hypothetical protein N2442_13860 [Spirochaetes bacterium]|nr:hypothetical protein [Spirochaetota bacterium]